MLVAGAVVQVVAWIGALIDTYDSPDKTWFVVLLIGGLLGLLGVVLAPFAVMVVYLISGPDTVRAETRPSSPGPLVTAS